MTATEGVSADYWRGAEAGVLVLQRCGSCGRIRHYPRVLCDRCWSAEVEPVQADGRGTVHSWTVTHHVFAPELADEVPYTLVTVDMTEGVRVLGRLDGDTAPALDLPVRIGFRPGIDGVPVPHFRPADGPPSGQPVGQPSGQPVGQPVEVGHPTGEGRS